MRILNYAREHEAYLVVIEQLGENLLYAAPLKVELVHDDCRKRPVEVRRLQVMFSHIVEDLIASRCVHYLSSAGLQPPRHLPLCALAAACYVSKLPTG